MRIEKEHDSVQSISEWIPVKRPPSVEKFKGFSDIHRSEPVLVFHSDYGPVIGYVYQYGKTGKLCWMGPHGDLQRKRVTHWMPLPKPPSIRKSK